LNPSPPDPPHPRPPPPYKQRPLRGKMPSRGTTHPPHLLKSQLGNNSLSHAYFKPESGKHAANRVYTLRLQVAPGGNLTRMVSGRPDSGKPAPDAAGLDDRSETNPVPRMMHEETQVFKNHLYSSLWGIKRNAWVTVP